MKRGFVLAELVVALTIFVLGMLSVVGTAVHASRTLTRATELEHAVTVAEGLADSLAAFGPTQGGSRAIHPSRAEWHVASDGSFRIVVSVRGDTLVDVSSREVTRGGA